MVKSILHTIDSRIIPSDEELLQLTDYLFKVEKWVTMRLLYLVTVHEQLTIIPTSY